MHHSTPNCRNPVVKEPDNSEYMFGFEKILANNREKAFCLDYEASPITKPSSRRRRSSRLTNKISVRDADSYAKPCDGLLKSKFTQSNSKTNKLSAKSRSKTVIVKTSPEKGDSIHLFGEGDGSPTVYRKINKKASKDHDKHDAELFAECSVLTSSTNVLGTPSKKGKKQTVHTRKTKKESENLNIKKTVTKTAKNGSLKNSKYTPFVPDIPWKEIEEHELVIE